MTLSLTGVGGNPVERRIYNLDPVVWLDAQRTANFISQGALTFLASDNQYLEADTAAATAFDFSFICWFKTPSSANQALVFLGDKDSDTDHSLMYITAGTVAAFSQIAAGNSQADSAASSYDDDAWHMAVAVFTAAGRTIYVDDAAGVTQATARAIDGTYDRTSVGRRGISTADLEHDGEISQAAIYNVALSAAQVVSLYNGGTMIDFATVLTPTAHWFLNDPSRVKWEDRVGSVNLTAAGGTGQPELTTGLRNEGATFVAASTQRLEVDVAADTAYPISVELKFKSGSSGADQTLFFLGDKDTADEFLSIRLDTAGDISAIASSNAEGELAATVAGSFGDDAWHSVLAVWTDATTRDVSVDGGSFTQETTSVVIGQTYDRTSLGRLGDSTPTLYLDGELDEVKLWGSALTAANGATLHNSGVPLSLQQTQSLVSPPDHYWSLDEHAPYLDAVGTLDLTPFGDTELPVSAAGPAETESVEGSALEQWVDRAKNGNTPVQATVTKRPELVKVPWDDGFRWAVRFDGVDDALAVATGSSVAQPFESFTVARFINASSGVNEYVWSDSTNPSFRRGTVDTLIPHAGTTGVAGSVSTRGFEIFNVEINGTSTKLIRNGVTDATGASGTLSLDNIILAASSSAGADPGYLDILEHLVFPAGLLSASKKALVLNYLRDKRSIHWGDVVATGPAASWSASSIGIKTAALGTGEDVSDTEGVGFLPDVSGHGVNITEPTVAEKPIFDADGINGRPSLSYSGAKALLVTNPALDNGVGLTVIAVATLSASGARGFLCIKGSAYYIRVESDGDMTTALGTDDKAFAVVHNGVSGLTAGVPSIIAFRYVSGSARLFVNGVELGSENTTFTGDVLDTSGDFFLGTNSSSGGNPWVGEIGQVMTFMRGLSFTELNAISQDMAAFYGITAAEAS